VKIVVDDANHVTAPWGSVNSRVFDALSSGALVITNGALGSHETFNGRLPTYSTASELTTLLKYFLTNDAERESLTKELSKFVRVEHSYQRRSEEFANSLVNLGITLQKHSIKDEKTSTKDSGISAQKDNYLNISSNFAPLEVAIL
jgi:O-antigen biosynthesis protein